MSLGINNGGPAFPVNTSVNDGQCGHQTGNTTWQFPGMTLRDYFALNLTSDEIRDHTYKSLSREAQEQLAGMAYPVEPPMSSGGGRPPEYYIAVLKFDAAVNAAIRFIAADAMLKARAAS